MVITSIILGIWAGLFIMAMTLGLNEQRMNGAVNSYLSHVQIHHPNFLDDQNLKYSIADRNILIEQLNSNSKIKSYAERVVSSGMIVSSKGSYGVQIIGVNPDQEKGLTTISSSLESGTYFSEFKRNPIVIGRKLAEKLKLDIKSKTVISLQDIEKNIISASFRVEGIFKTNSSIHDESSIYVKAEDLNEIAGLSSQIHEIAILCNNIDDADELVSGLKKISSSNKVESWDKIAPELGYAQEMMSSMIYIFMGIVLIALAFSIINTMLMAILERKKELGMLKAIGMNNRRIFLMILFETIFIVLIATPIGMLLSFLSINYFGEYGIDLSAVAEGLESLGVGSKIFTYLPINLYINITLLTLLIAFISALFPAKRALKLKPTEVIS